MRPDIMTLSRSGCGALVLAILLVCSLMARCAIAEDEAPVQFEFSGVLGQSQPDGEEALPFVGAAGAVVDRGGHLWTAAGQQLFEFVQREKGHWVCAERRNLPAPVSQLGMRWDGERIFVAGSDGILYTLTPGPGAIQPAAGIRFGGKARAFAVAPLGLSRGYGARGKVFVLEGDTIKAYTATGKPADPSLPLARPAAAAWWYCDLGIEPITGDLLVGSYYPDSTIYRFDARGRQVKEQGWPRKGQSAALVALGTQTWMLTDGGGAALVPPVPSANGEENRIGSAWTQYISGLTRDQDGGYWIASSQGLCRYDRKGKAAQERLGGLSGIRSLAVDPDGTVIASIEGGQRMLRLSLDDEAAAPLLCNANEPWRIGAGWTNRACSLAWDRQQFLVLDETSKMLWSFDPGHTAWGETPWVRRTEPNLFAGPRGLAVGDALVWVLDGNRLLEGRQPLDQPFQEVRLPGLENMRAVVGIAAAEDNCLIVALRDRLQAFSRSAKGTYRFLWESVVRFENCTSLTVTRGCVAVADGKGRCVTALSLITGHVLGKIGYGAVKGGMMPGSLAAAGKWLLVADEDGKRILRLKLSPSTTRGARTPTPRGARTSPGDLRRAARRLCGTPRTGRETARGRGGWPCRGRETCGARRTSSMPQSTRDGARTRLRRRSRR